MTDSISATRFIESPKELLKYVEETGDVDAVFDTVRILYHAALTLDSQLDIILPGTEDLWDRISLPEEYRGMSFYEAMTRMTPLSDMTIQRHTRFGKMIEKVPEKYRHDVEKMDRKSKNRLLSVVEEDYEISDGQWDRITGSFSDQSVGEVVREIKGTEPRSQWCMFKVDESGAVWAHTDIGMFKVIEPIKYENEEIQAKMDWVYEKMARKLGATPK